VDGQIVSRGSYPSRTEFAALLGLKVPEKRLALNVVACGSTDGDCC